MTDIETRNGRRSNNGPVTTWRRIEMACGTVRHTLYVNGNETPYFIYDAKRAGCGHWHQGDPVGLYAAGAGNEVHRRDGSSYRIAGLLQSCARVSVAKAAAERRAAQS